MLSALVLLLSLDLPPRATPMPLCLTVAAQELSLDLTDRPDVSATTVRFSRWDRTHIAAELRARGLTAEEAERAVGVYRLVPRTADKPRCGTCFLAIWFAAKRSCGSYYGSQWCLSCMAPCPVDPMPIAGLR